MTHTITETKHRAFTLIELLVVISIISLLIAILLPALASARASAYAMQCGSNSRQIAIIMKLYGVDNKDYIITSTISGEVWNTYLASKYMRIRPALFANGIRPPTIFACPATDLLMTGGFKSDYGLNYKINGGNFKYRYADLINPGKLIATADAVARSLTPNGTPNVSIFHMEGRHKNRIGPLDPNNTVNVLYWDGHAVKKMLKDIPFGSSWNKVPWLPPS